MARIQILELPSEQVGDVYRTPFMLVFDRVDKTRLLTHSGETVRTVPDDEFAMIEEMGDELKAASGAVGIIVFAGELEVG